MVIVRLLLFAALACIGVSLLLFFIKRDRRYLRFIGQVAKFTLILLAASLLFHAGKRLLASPQGTSVSAPTPSSGATSARATRAAGRHEAAPRGRTAPEPLMHLADSSGFSPVQDAPRQLARAP